MINCASTVSESAGGESLWQSDEFLSWSNPSESDVARGRPYRPPAATLRPLRTCSVPETGVLSGIDNYVETNSGNLLESIEWRRSRLWRQILEIFTFWIAIHYKKSLAQIIMFAGYLIAIKTGIDVRNRLLGGSEVSAVARKSLGDTGERVRSPMTPE